MPDPTLIDSTTQALTNATNYLQASNLNRRNRKFAEKQYERQRADNLSDWTRQNEYNSPSSQMARLREAGLNPNLVYGKGADNTAGAVHSASPQPSQGRLPEMRFDAQRSLMAGYDLQLRQAQVDNLKVQNTVLDQERILKEAQTIATLSSGARTQFDLDLDTELRDTSAEMRRQTLRKLQADTAYTLNQDERAKAMNSSNLKEALERVITMRMQRGLIPLQKNELQEKIDGIQKDNRLKQLDIDLREKGIMPHDNIFFRVLARLLEDYLPRLLPAKPYRLQGDETDSFGRPR